MGAPSFPRGLPACLTGSIAVCMPACLRARLAGHLAAQPWWCSAACMQLYIANQAPVPPTPTPTPPRPLAAAAAFLPPPRAAAYARRAVEQAEKLRQQKREEQERLKKDKQFSWNQKVGGCAVCSCCWGLGEVPWVVWLLWGGGSWPQQHDRTPTVAAVLPLPHPAIPSPSTHMSVCLPACPACLLQEKRKRDEGKASRGKNYVEEEKRRAREFGIVSGFD